MAIATHIAEKCAEALNDGIHSNDFSEALDLFAPEASLSYQLGEEAEHYYGHEEIQAWFTTMTSEWEFVPLTSEEHESGVEGDFEIQGGSPAPVSGHWTFDVNEEGKIENLTIQPR